VRAVPAIGLRSDHGSDEIPASHRDLVQCPPVAALITVMPDGYPQTSVEWCDVDGGVRAGQRHAWLRKEHNMRRNRGSGCCAMTPASRCAIWRFAARLWR
jgi:hypothetical protein